MFLFEEKIWGSVVHLFDDETSVSILDILPNFRCSNHHHNHRYNAFWVISGRINVVTWEVGEGLDKSSDQILFPGQSFIVPPKISHRFECREKSKVVEIYWTTDGTKVDIDDIVRIDHGGRI